MSFFHVVTWIDQAQAHVIHFNSEAAVKEIVKVRSAHVHLHAKSGTARVMHIPENIGYFDDVAKVLTNALEILIVGPCLEKLAFIRYLMEYQPGLVERIVGVETVAHPSDGQLFAYARRYFVKAIQLQ